MKKRIRQIMAITLSASMALGLCGCGGGSGTSKNTSGQEHYFSVSYLDELPENLAQLGSSMFKGDCLYYTAYDEDYTTEHLYSYNLVEKTESVLWERTDEQNEDGITTYSAGINNFTVDDDGNVYAYMYVNAVQEDSLSKDYSSATLDDVLDYMVNEWGYEENDAAEEWDQWYKDDYTDEDGNVNYGNFLKSMALEYDYSNVVQKIDPSGNVVYELSVNEDSDDYSSYCSDIEVDQNGYLYVNMNRWNNEGTEDTYYVDVYDTDGTKKGTVNFDDYAYNLIALSDGRVGCVSYGEGTELVVIDPDSMSITDTYEILSENLSPYDGDTVLMNYNSGLILYNLKDQSEEELLTWMDCNISSSSVNSFGVLSDGTLGVLTQTWSSSVTTDIAILTEVDESEVVQSKEIKIACMWIDSNLEEMAIEYNKKHEDYHITITQYYDDTVDDWDEMLNSFTTAIANDTDIDIIVFDDYSQVTNFASKGLLTDLYPLIENDSDLSTDDFLPNVLTACEFDGQLLALPTSFSLYTVVGKTEDVGTESGWTIEDAKALLASKPEGTELFDYTMTRDTMLSNLISLNYRDFIDPVNATCTFDTQEFVDVLEFANMFPEDYEWDEDVDSADQLHNGEVLLDTYYLNDFEEIQLYETVFGGPLTFIGYPTSEGNGALLSLNSVYGITTNCDVPDVAWDFLSQLYQPDSDDYYYGFSIRKDDFEQYCAQAMEEDEYGGGSYGWGNYEVEIQPATQEQVDTVKDLVYNTTAVSGAISTDILNLINEEAAYYFSGEQTAEDVAAKIQSRMEIYLSETK
jgi:ABC-type glycerol-3-phosphate transport system substrate-binding protein